MQMQGGGQDTLSAATAKHMYQATQRFLVLSQLQFVRPVSPLPRTLYMDWNLDVETYESAREEVTCRSCPYCCSSCSLRDSQIKPTLYWP